MADPPIDDDPNDPEVDAFTRALARDAIAENPVGTPRSSMREWLGPALGAAVLLVGAGGVAYRVISGYRHASTEAFVSVQDQNKQPVASAANHPVEAPMQVTAPPQSTPSAPPIVPVAAAPPITRGEDSQSGSSSAADADLPAEAQDKAACVAIKTEQQEIDAALRKQYSAEEGRYLQRRLRELAEQSGKRKCGA